MPVSEIFIGMKQSNLKRIIREIVRNVMNEVDRLDYEWEFDKNSGVVSITDLLLPDGRAIGAEVEIIGEWDREDIPGKHRDIQRSPQYGVNNWKTIRAWDMETQMDIPMDAALSTVINGVMEKIAPNIPDSMEGNEPESDPNFWKASRDDF